MAKKITKKTAVKSKTKKPLKADDRRIGNKFAEKFKTPEARQKAFKAFCKHLGNGYSAKSFHDPCVENTILQMINDYPDEFEKELLSMAKAKSCFVWEQMGKAGTLGKLKGFNASSWIWTTKNKLNWKDKTENINTNVNIVVSDEKAKKALEDL